MTSQKATSLLRSWLTSFIILAIARSSDGPAADMMMFWLNLEDAQSFNESTAHMTLSWSSFEYSCSPNSTSLAAANYNPPIISCGNSYNNALDEFTSSYSPDLSSVNQLKVQYGSFDDIPSNSIEVKEIVVTEETESESGSRNVSNNIWCVPPQWNASVADTAAESSGDCTGNALQTTSLILDYDTINLFYVDMDLNGTNEETISDQIGYVRLPKPISFIIELNQTATIDDAQFTLFSDGTAMQCTADGFSSSVIHCNQTNGNITVAECGNTTDFKLHLYSPIESLFVDTITIRFENNRSYVLEYFCGRGFWMYGMDRHGSCTNTQFDCHGNPDSCKRWYKLSASNSSFEMIWSFHSLL